MKYQIKIIRINKDWIRIEYDNKEFTEIDQVLEYLGDLLESTGQSTFLIYYKKFDGV